ncbi:carbohydrate ABC transporter permease [Acidiphilium sp. AL]|uniref:Carbohydrate ABC transporter permease n=1 Tax=Acidiphilium iwatense TaxID=768198 RepID=A0ABS9DXY4_9PROT|nr:MULTISPECIES: carbohydrate ABC transporter permease [Acidiphilium]MCF3946556.1 carbohydrate ABC transporter permease [Acidiphilium iwatense]MCU4160263.1 carbohydrate ABC transporter permease [Acidiphilium sp. AL]
MKPSISSRVIFGVLAWIAALVMFFPILWMLITAFKTEGQAIAIPPLLIFPPTFESFLAATNNAGYILFAINSVVVSIGSTVLAIAIAFPAAYALAFFPGKRTEFTLMWMLSTKMLPAVGVLMPIYLGLKEAGLLDTRIGLVGIDTLMNLPIVVWMLYSFFKEIPGEILEAARVDGIGPRKQMVHLLLPLSGPGIASTALLSVILSWNEAFWSINVTASRAGTLAAYIARFSAPEGLFWAKLSAASVLAVAPILVFGSLTQRRLVRGLTFGAVK